MLEMRTVKTNASPQLTEIVTDGGAVAADCIGDLEVTMHFVVGCGEHAHRGQKRNPLIAAAIRISLGSIRTDPGPARPSTLSTMRPARWARSSASASESTTEWVSSGAGNFRDCEVAETCHAPMPWVASRAEGCAWGEEQTKGGVGRHHR